MVSDIVAIIEGIIYVGLGIFFLTVPSKKINFFSSYRRKKIFKILTIIFLIAYGIWRPVEHFIDKRNESVDYSKVIKEANNLMAGKYVDEFTRVDSVILGPQGEFIYNYTVNMESTEFESLAREALKDTLSARIRRSQVADFLKEGIPIVVKYSGSDGILITEVRMEPEIERP